MFSLIFVRFKYEWCTVVLNRFDGDWNMRRRTRVLVLQVLVGVLHVLGQRLLNQLGVVVHVLSRGRVVVRDEPGHALITLDQHQAYLYHDRACT